MAEGHSQTAPFPPNGIGLYSKNSTVSHLPRESGGIRTDTHAKVIPGSALQLPNSSRLTGKPEVINLDVVRFTQMVRRLIFPGSSCRQIQEIIDMQIRSVGIDLGKTTFHLLARGDNGKVVLKKKFT
jgi:hypothetical protein